MKNINTLMLAFWQDFKAVQKDHFGPYAPQVNVLYAAYTVLWAVSMGVSWQATLLMTLVLALIFSFVYKMQFSELFHEYFERMEQGKPTMLGSKILSMVVLYAVSAYAVLWSIVAFR